MFGGKKLAIHHLTFGEENRPCIFQNCSNTALLVSSLSETAFLEISNLIVYIQARGTNINTAGLISTCRSKNVVVSNIKMQVLAENYFPCFSANSAAVFQKGMVKAKGKDIYLIDTGYYDATESFYLDECWIDEGHLLKQTFPLIEGGRYGLRNCASKKALYPSEIAYTVKNYYSFGHLSFCHPDSSPFDRYSSDWKRETCSPQLF